MATVPLHRVGFQEVQRNWGWYLAHGIILVLFGTIAIGRVYLVTKVSVMFFGWLMIIAGMTELLHAFWKERGWSGFFIDLLTGILYVVVGFMIVGNPQATAVTLTLLITMFLIFDGIFRIATALSVPNPNWIWMLLHGVVTLVLGIMIWRQWPLSGVWVIGLFVGIQMLLNGWSLVMLALAAKNLPAGDEVSPAPAS